MRLACPGCFGLFPKLIYISTYFCQLLFRKFCHRLSTNCFAWLVFQPFSCWRHRFTIIIFCLLTGTLHMNWPMFLLKLMNHQDSGKNSCRAYIWWIPWKQWSLWSIRSGSRQFVVTRELKLSQTALQHWEHWPHIDTKITCNLTIPPHLWLTCNLTISHLWFRILN